MNETEWITLDFLILWRRHSCPGPYKNIFHEVHNLTDWRTYSNPGRYFLTINYIPWQVITSINQCFFKRRHLPSPHCKAWHFLIGGLDVDWVEKLPPHKKKFFERIRTRESSLRILRKKYMTKNLKEFCQLDSKPLIRSHSSSLNVLYRLQDFGNSC